MEELEADAKIASWARDMLSDTSPLMSDLSKGLSFNFKIDTMTANEYTPPESFRNGSYKPPIRRQNFIHRSSTDWYQWTTAGLLSATQTAPPLKCYVYSTSIFYDGRGTNRFLFFPGDCQSVDISDVEELYTERYGWQHLCFTEKGPGHTVLDHDGEYDTLRGPPGSYSPHLLPLCYRSTEQMNQIGLSGKMSLLLALTAFSCRHDKMIEAIAQRLNFKERRWVNGDVQGWGNGRKFPLTA